MKKNKKKQKAQTKWKWKWSDIRPSMVTHTRNLCSAFNPSKVNTHTLWTHTRSSGQPFMLRRLGSSWGFGALLKGTSVMVLKVERVLDIHSPHLQFLPARDSNSQPFDYESDSLTIRPRLPKTSQNEQINKQTKKLKSLVTSRVCERSGAATISPPHSEHLKITPLHSAHILWSHLAQTWRSTPNIPLAALKCLTTNLVQTAIHWGGFSEIAH